MLSEGLSLKMIIYSNLIKPVNLFQSVVVIPDIACSKPSTFLSCKHNHQNSQLFFWLISSNSCNRRG